MTFGRAFAIRRVGEFSRTQEILDVAREFTTLAVDGSFAAEVEVVAESARSSAGQRPVR